MIPRERILEKLDSLLRANDYQEAKRLLEYWLFEAEYMGDQAGKLLLENELMGLCRKLGEKEAALKYSGDALNQLKKMGAEHTVGAATTFINSGTVLKAFGNPQEALPLFEKARGIYEANLPQNDGHFGGLYNNMGLVLVDLGRFEEANELYLKAIAVMESIPQKEPEAAITYLNMATAAEKELGLDKAKSRISFLAEKAMTLMDKGKERTDGNYAFVCEKCASVFGYYGYGDYAAELKNRSRRIYEGT